MTWNRRINERRERRKVKNKKEGKKEEITKSRCFPLDFTGPNLEAVLEREVPVLVEGSHVCLHVSPYAARVPGVDLRHKGRTIIPFKSWRVSCYPFVVAVRPFQVKPASRETGNENETE